MLKSLRGLTMNKLPNQDPDRMQTQVLSCPAQVEICAGKEKYLFPSPAHSS